MPPMAAQILTKSNIEQEGEIPVLTVIKSNAILKNIYIINPASSISETRRQDLEHTLLVGRHPESEIRLGHSSISRFHLRIHYTPSSKLLSVTDLSSVHGTWISGKKIEPGVRVDLKEGDELKFGGSTRVYKLNWIPLSKAYDSDNPFVPVLPQLDDETEEEIEVKVNHPKQVERRWTMVVEVASLVNETSRKAIQLLEGIKGTQLIIPFAVMKELDAMKQQSSLYGNNTEAHLASQWIEECVARTKWWIQIQSTATESVSSFTQDPVLDFALYTRKLMKDERLVVLSDVPAMKLKAMAEGLICETAEEFQASLVSPFSKRFLWIDSLPMGRTWSYFDTEVPRKNKFYPKGLKLIVHMMLRDSAYE